MLQTLHHWRLGIVGAVLTALLAGSGCNQTPPSTPPKEKPGNKEQPKKENNPKPPGERG